MERKTLKVLLMPSYRTTAKYLGLDSDEIYNNDAILFQQGFDMKAVIVEAGNQFKISNNFECGTVDCDEIGYKLMERGDNDDDEFDLGESDNNNLTLAPGKYFFHHDGIMIEKISEEFDDDDDDWGESEDAQSDPVHLLISNAIIESTKRRFDYETFAEDFNEIDEGIAPDVIWEVIVNFASGESSAILIEKIFSRFLIMGFTWDRKAINEFVYDKEEVFTLEISALKMAWTMLSAGASEYSVLEFIQKFLK